MTADEQRSQAEEAKAVLLVPSPRDTLPYPSWVVWSSVLWLLGDAPFIPISPLAFLTFAPLVFGFWLGFRQRGRPLGTYVLCGVAVGFATVAGVFTVGGLLFGLPGDFFSIASLSTLFAEYFIEPALMFLSGTLLGNFIKQRALGAQTTTAWQKERELLLGELGQEREERRREREQAESTLQAERDRLQEDQRREQKRVDELREEVDRLREDLETERSKGFWRRRLLGR